MTQQNLQEKELAELEQKIKTAQANGENIDKYVLRQIEILQNSVDAFLKQMEKENRLNDVHVAQIEIRQYSVMKELAKKINLPDEKYNALIKQAQIRIFGEENWENFFSEND